MPNYTVKQGDCIASIANEHGFFWETLWNLSENAALKTLRKDPNALFPGDTVFIPEKRIDWDTKATDARHVFVLKGGPIKLKIRLAINDQPLANKRCRVWIDGNSREATTDGDGFLEQPIPPNASRGKIAVGEGEQQMVFEFDFGTIDPIDTEDGVRERLMDIGYDVENGLEDALRTFQQKEGLPVTGQIDDGTQAKIKEKFGQ
jgi:hypothetical protein